MGSKGQNSTLSEYSNVAYQIKGNDACSNMVATILPVAPSPDPRGGIKDQNLTFSEYGLVAYQIKGDDACSNMVAHILPTQALPTTLGEGVKIQLLQNMVKFNLIESHGSTNFASRPPPRLPIMGGGG